MRPNAGRRKAVLLLAALAVVVSGAAGLAGCGQKGPLLLPDQAAPAAQSNDAGQANSAGQPSGSGQTNGTGQPSGTGQANGTGQSSGTGQANGVGEPDDEAERERRNSDAGQDGATTGTTDGR